MKGQGLVTGQSRERWYSSKQYLSHKLLDYQQTTTQFQAPHVFKSKRTAHNSVRCELGYSEINFTHFLIKGMMCCYK
jgi:hypothetical protein